MIFKEKTPKTAPIPVYLDAKESQWAAFCRFWARFTSSFYFLYKNAVSIPLFQEKKYLGRNKTRNVTCQKQLHQLHFFWPLAFQRVHLLLLALSKSLLRSLQNQLHKNTKTFSQEPVSVLGITPQHDFKTTFGGVS